MGARGSLVRSGVAAVLASFALLGCEGQQQSLLNPDFRILTPGGPYPSPGDGTPVNEAFELCKVGSDGDFTYSVVNRSTGALVRSGQLTLAAGACMVLTESGGGGARVTVTEQPRAGFRIATVQVDVIVGTAGNTTTTTTYQTGPTVVDSVGGIPLNHRGVVVRFYNEPIPTYSLGDFVWNDVNGNGIQDAGEPGLAGLTVTLGGDATATTTTDANGNYLFSGLYAGNYTVTVGTPSGFSASPSGQGSDTAKDSNGSPASVALSADDLTIDFGFVPLPPPPTSVTLCKVGSAADFTVTAGSSASVTLGNGECRIVYNHAGGTPDQSVTMTESVPTGYQLDSIRVTGGPLYTGTNSATVISGDAGDITVTFYNSPLPPPPSGGQGCTPGYWKQTQHFDSWTAPYTPSTLFSSVFADAFPGKTLLQVLGQGGGGLNALGRHTVAALLSSASSGVNYDLSTAAVIAAFNAAYASGNYETQKNIFAAYNE